MSSTRTAKPLPTGFVTKHEVNRIVNNYMTQKHPLLSTALGRDDSRAAWYSIAQFEELMREMYYQHASGLRIYFGACDSNDLFSPNQLTIIFVPTYLDQATGKHRDIIIDDSVDYPVRNATESAPSNSGFKNLNSIGLCPPSCGGHELSYPYNESLT